MSSYTPSDERWTHFLFNLPYYIGVFLVILYMFSFLFFFFPQRILQKSCSYFSILDSCFPGKQISKRINFKKKKNQHLLSCLLFIFYLILDMLMVKLPSEDNRTLSKELHINYSQFLLTEISVYQGLSTIAYFPQLISLSKFLPSPSLLLSSPSPLLSLMG